MHYSPAPMHIPDGFLTIIVSAFCWLLTVAMVAIAIKKTNQALKEKQVPLMGIMAAFIFAAQMINFPVAGGTSGHLLGGALAAIVLGPWAAILVMTSVIAVQGLLFQDGGLLVMGANILNMGIFTVIVGYGIYRLTANQPKGMKLAGATLAAWLSVVAGALTTALELWLSGTAKLEIVVPSMIIIHTAIGVGEALITLAAVGFLMQTRPDLLGAESAGSKGGKGWVLAGILLSLAVVILSPLASTSPDGLERVAHDLGFIQAAQTSPLRLIPDYSISFLGQTPLSTVVAGLLGVLVILGIFFLIAKGLRSKPAK